MIATAVHLLGRVWGGWLRGLLRDRRASLWYLIELSALAVDYAYWVDFFATHRVRINVGTINTPVSQMLALDALGGVSVAYQFSTVSDLTASSQFASGGDVQFIFAPAFEPLWRSVRSPAAQILSSGFVYDGALEPVRQRAQAQAVRRALERHGVRYLLCFFDESSINKWEFDFTNEDAAQEYRFLLQWLLDDPTLGLIVKPKHFGDLFERIRSVMPLVEAARQTGRCAFLGSEAVVGHIFPTEAALQADVCIGKLTGGTAAFEAQLAGVPTLLVDTEGLAAHPFYRWGSHGVIFRDWAKLRQAVEQFRRAPNTLPGFGDWSEGLSDLDPFRDGQGTARLGSYIGWLYEALARGASKQEAMAIAGQRYAARWSRRPTPAEVSMVVR